MRKKLENLILYICASEDAKLGRTKLNKLLYFCDFLHYQKTGKDITGADYMAIQEGPVPRQMLPTLERLYENDKLRQEPIRVGAHWLQRQIALVEPDLSIFTASEISMVDEVIDRFRWFTGKQLSDYTHSHPGYIVAKHKESIPLATAFFPVFSEITDEDVALTKELAESHGWSEKYPGTRDSGGVGDLSDF